MKTLRPLAATIAVVLASTSMSTMAANALEIKTQNAAGKPTFVVGDLGSTSATTTVSALQKLISNEASFAANGNEGFKVKEQWVDTLGKRHTRIQQTINGLPVYGTGMIVHADGGLQSIVGGVTPSNIYAVSGNLALNNEPAINLSLVQSKANVAGHVAKLAQEIGDMHGEPELSYVYLPQSGKTKLAYRTEVSWDNSKGFGRDFIYFDAKTSEVLIREAQVHSAKSWKTYHLDGGAASQAPGRLLCTDNQSCGDAAGQRAHDGAAVVYDYFKGKFNRDSLDNNGMAMVSSVGMGEANAYWTGAQMIYGAAANGLNDFTADFDVIGHEFTHGVTDKTANLRYQNASGALNEAWSDILGLSAEAFRAGKTTSTWLLGDGLYNNQPGKALRYMDNPTKDNYSKDWYPERIPFVSRPTNSNDYGGVHGNSGIANLAYVLLVDGGTHPRGKSTANVPSIGMAKAEQIFYRALVTYMGQNTTFAEARTATAQSAQDLYGAAEKTAVETAWCAVGVGSCPSTGGDTGSTLENGVAKTGLSASAGQEVVFTMDVPSGATNIKFDMTGGTGDADMYVKFGAAPTDTVHDCRPYKTGNVESCSLTSAGGKYYVRIKAYSTFSGVSLTGSYTAGSTGGLDPISGSVNNISVSKGQWKHYTQTLAAGYKSMVVSMSGGSGDADLYVRHGAQSTTSLHDCRPYKNGNNETCTLTNPAAGTWYIDLNGYKASSGITLSLTATP